MKTQPNQENTLRVICLQNEFTLVLWDTYTLSGGRTQLGYRLSQGSSSALEGVPIFEGEDFGCSPLHAVDSDASVYVLMCFLCMRLGDTDADYFANYTPAQLAFRDEWAERVFREVEDRFGDDEGVDDGR